MRVQNRTRYALRSMTPPRRRIPFLAKSIGLLVYTKSCGTLWKSSLLPGVAELFGYAISTAPGTAERHYPLALLLSQLPRD